MEGATENGKESSHSAHANVINEYLYVYAVESSGRTMVMNSKKPYEMELVHTTFITPMLQALQTRVQGGTEWTPTFQRVIKKTNETSHRKMAL